MNQAQGLLWLIQGLHEAPRSDEEEELQHSVVRAIQRNDRCGDQRQGWPVDTAGNKSRKSPHNTKLEAKPGWGGKAEEGVGEGMIPPRNDTSVKLDQEEAGQRYSRGCDLNAVDVRLRSLDFVFCFFSLLELLSMAVVWPDWLINSQKPRQQMEHVSSCI